MTYLVQVADVCIYCVNWGYRLDAIGLDGESRPEIVEAFGPWLRQLQFKGSGYRDGQVFESYGIFHVADPYGTESSKEKGGNTPGNHTRQLPD